MSEPVEDILYCYRHPKVETQIRCYQCGNPICTRCMKRTPVGYICPDCAQGRKQRFEQARTADYVVAGIVSLVLGGIAGYILPLTGWFTIFLSPLAGGLIAEVVWRLVGRRYGSALWWLVAGGIIVGTLPALALYALGAAVSLQQGVGWSLVGLLWPVVHGVMAVGAASARLRLR
jgi:hypothetical protein